MWVLEDSTCSLGELGYKKRNTHTPISTHYLETNSDHMYLKIAVKSQTPVLSSFQPLRKQSRLSGLLWSVNVLTVFNGVLTCFQWMCHLRMCRCGECKCNIYILYMCACVLFLHMYAHPTYICIHPHVCTYIYIYTYTCIQ